MASYESFARVYDLFMDNVPYDEWSRWYIERLHRFGIEDGLVLDLGCGTGQLTERLARAGYDMIGVDYSADMLEIAQEKKYESGLDILYLMQDMRSFELYGSVRAIICACDSLNYILEDEDLQEVFRLVHNYLDPGGVFLFDVNAPYKYETLLGDRTIAESREDGAFIWENSYDPEDRINEFDLTLFIREEDELFSRYQELHEQRAWTPQEVESFLKAAGFEVWPWEDAYTGQQPGAESERYCFMARKSGGA